MVDRLNLPHFYQSIQITCQRLVQGVTGTCLCNHQTNIVHGFTHSNNPISSASKWPNTHRVGQYPIKVYIHNFYFCRVRAITIIDLEILSMYGQKICQSGSRISFYYYFWHHTKVSKTGMFQLSPNPIKIGYNLL